MGFVVGGKLFGENCLFKFFDFSNTFTMAELIKVFAQRDRAEDWAEVSIYSNESVAAAKEVILAKLGVTDPIDQVTLWTVDGAGAPIKLDARRSVDCQLVAGNTVTVKVEPIRAGLAPGACGRRLFSLCAVLVI